MPPPPGMLAILQARGPAVPGRRDAPRASAMGRPGSLAGWVELPPKAAPCSRRVWPHASIALAGSQARTPASPPLGGRHRAQSATVLLRLFGGRSPRFLGTPVKYADRYPNHYLNPYRDGYLNPYRDGYAGDQVAQRGRVTRKERA